MSSNNLSGYQSKPHRTAATMQDNAGKCCDVGWEEGIDRIYLAAFFAIIN